MRGKIITWSILVVLALGIVPLFVSDTFVLRILTEAIMWIGLAIAFDVLAGYTGYLNFGHGAFFGIGAYATAILMVQANWPFAMAVLAAAVITALCALAAGIPTLRLRDQQRPGH
jgi:branched-chain amino acid transport system permease protein